MPDFWPEVVIIPDCDEATNVVGSAEDKRYKKLQVDGTRVSSWLSLWKLMVHEGSVKSRECRSPKCCVQGCYQAAEVGAHIHVGEPSCEVNYIVPFCSHHNKDRCADLGSKNGYELTLDPRTPAIMIPALEKLCRNGVPNTRDYTCKAPGPKLTSSDLDLYQLIGEIDFGDWDIEVDDEVFVFYGRNGCPYCPPALREVSFYMNENEKVLVYVSTDKFRSREEAISDFDWGITPQKHADSLRLIEALPEVEGVPAIFRVDRTGVEDWTDKLLADDWN